jgi:pimeloyl-ACP methyl ester carboxylesterase
MRLFAYSVVLMFCCLILVMPVWAQEQPAEPDEAVEPPIEVPEILPDFDLEDMHDDVPDEQAPTRPDEIEWLRDTGFDTVVCPFRDRIDYRPGEIECGLIQVPENREVEGSRTIELHFVRIMARGEDEDGNEVDVRDDPVIYLTGGPGVKADMYVERLKDHRLVDQRDLYILEQRGIGVSGDFCPFFFDRNRVDYIRDNFADNERSIMEQARECARLATAAGVDLTGYHTFENARDVRALRQALGLADWNVWGISYGSVLGQAYMKIDPEGIRAVVLDAIVPLDLENLMRIPHWHTLNLEKLFAACVEQHQCARVYADLAERYHQAIANLIDQPIRVEVPESEIHPTGEAYFFQNLIVGLPFSLLYDESNHPLIPAIMHGLTRAVEKRDQRLFRAIAMAEGGSGLPISMGMAMSVRCLDGYVDRGAEAAPGDFRDYPLLAQAFGDQSVIAESPDHCRAAGLHPRDPADFELVQTDLPILVANGAWDPVTPVPLAEYIMPGFSNGRLLVFPHAGHGPTRSLDCAGGLLNGFFDDPAAPLDSDCVEHGGKAAEFVAPYFQTSLFVRAIVMHTENPERMKRHAVAAGVLLGLIVIGVFGLLGSWLSRRFNRHRVKAAGGSRFLVFLAGALVLGWLVGLGWVAHATSQVTEVMLLFGLMPRAMWFAWLAPLGLLLAILGLIQAWRYSSSLNASALAALGLTALATILLSLYGLYWGIWPI